MLKWLRPLCSGEDADGSPVMLMCDLLYLLLYFQSGPEAASITLCIVFMSSNICMASVLLQCNQSSNVWLQGQV